MKRLLIVIGAVVFIGMALAGCGGAATKVRIGIAETFPPFATVEKATLKLVGSERYGIAVCNQKADVLKKINAGLAAVKADGALATLAKKWGIGG